MVCGCISHPPRQFGQCPVDKLLELTLASRCISELVVYYSELVVYGEVQGLGELVVYGEVQGLGELVVLKTWGCFGCTALHNNSTRLVECCLVSWTLGWFPWG